MMKKIIFIFIMALGLSLYGKNLVKATEYLPSAYDSNNVCGKDYVTDPKKQYTSTCWAYAGTAAAESSILKNNVLENETANGENQLNLSEFQLLYYTFHDYDSEGNNLWDSMGNVKNRLNVNKDTNIGGNIGCIVSAYSAWIGPTKEDAITCEKNIPGKAYNFSDIDNDYAYNRDIVHLKGAYSFDSTQRTEIKKAIMKYGACYYDYYPYKINAFYDKNKNKIEATYYGGTVRVSTHAVCVIGWDDNFAKENFGANNQPQNDGAWLVKNSSSPDRICYISYENVSFSKFTFFDFESSDDYTYNYQYDGLAMYDIAVKNAGSDYGQMGNIFTSQHNDTVKAAGFYTDQENTAYKIYIYKNCKDTPTSGTLVSTTSGVQPYAGYHVEKLATTVDVKKGEKYAVVVEIEDKEHGNPLVKTSGCNHYADPPGEEGISFYRFSNDNEWTDIYKQTKRSCFRIKAFTDLSTYSVSVANDSSVNAVVSYDNTAVLKDGDTFTFNVDAKNGYVRGQLGVLVNDKLVDGDNGTYTIKNVDQSIKIKVIDTSTEFPVNYHLNGGVFMGAGASYSYRYKSGLVLPTNATKTGYTFLGWSTSKDDNTAYVSKIDPSEYGSKTFYAVWKANSYKVRFAANAGYGSMTEQTMTYDQSAVLKRNTMERDGYGFLGWNTEADGSGVSYTNGETVSNLATDDGATVTLYAQWKEDVYTVHFDANTGSGDMQDCKLAFQTAGNLPQNAYMKKGYVFAGWSLEPEGNVIYEDKGYVLDLADTATKTVTLYAQWKPITYTIKYHANGGVDTVADSIFTYDQEDQLRYCAFYKTGHYFTKWNTKADGSGTSYDGEEKVLNMTDENGKEIDLYAQWDVDSYFSIFYLDGGYMKDGAEQSIRYTYGTGCILPEAFKPGYNFVGWYDSYEDRVITEIGPDETRCMDLKALYKPATYTITYETDGGTINSGDKYYYEFGNSYILPTDVTKPGYTFAGWYTSEYFVDDRTKVTEISDTDYDDKVFYAKWEKDTVDPTDPPAATEEPTQTPGTEETATPAPTIKPTDIVVPTVEPTQSPEVKETATPVPTIKPTDIAVPTVEPTQTPEVNETATPAPTIKPTDIAVPTVEPTQTPEVKETATPAPTIKPTDIAVPTVKLTEVTPSVHPVNKVKVYKGITYKVVKNSVTVIKAKKSLKKASIPNTMKVSGKTYKVTKVANNAFKGCKKLKKVTIGKNVTKIGKNAFKECKKLKQIIIKTAQLKCVGSKAFEKISKKAVITIPKDQATKYNKMLKNYRGKFLWK